MAMAASFASRPRQRRLGLASAETPGEGRMCHGAADMGAGRPQPTRRRRPMLAGPCSQGRLLRTGSRWVLAQIPERCLHDLGLVDLHRGLLEGAAPIVDVVWSAFTADSDRQTVEIAVFVRVQLYDPQDPGRNGEQADGSGGPGLLWPLQKRFETEAAQDEQQRDHEEKVPDGVAERHTANDRLRDWHTCPGR